jgi:hypothetical protein
MNLLPIAAIILLVASIILIVPFQLSFHLRIAGFSTCGFYRILWFGRTLYRRDLISPKSVEEGKRVKLSTENDDYKDIAHKKSKLHHNRIPKDIGMSIDAVPAFFCVLKDLMRSIRIKHLSCNATFGLSDPADTAILSGYSWALASAVPFPAAIRLDPYFYGERLEGSIDAEIWIRISWIIIAAINAIREKSIRRLLKELIKEKISDNKPLMKWPKRSMRGRSIGKGLGL